MAKYSNLNNLSPFSVKLHECIYKSICVTLQLYGLDFLNLYFKHWWLKIKWQNAASFCSCKKLKYNYVILFTLQCFVVCRHVAVVEALTVYTYCLSC